MPLSPTDFYAYSKATGTPVPETPEERAQLAPKVVEFRRSQLKIPQEGPDYGAIAGVAALGAGLVGAGLGIRSVFTKGPRKGGLEAVANTASALAPTVRNLQTTNVAQNNVPNIQQATTAERLRKIGLVPGYGTISNKPILN